MTLLASGLVLCAVLLAWPAERIHRLHKLALPAEQSDVSLLASVRSIYLQRKLTQDETQRAIDALASLEAELRAGQSPSAALRASGGSPSVWPTALAALSLGGDVTEGLRIDARSKPMLGQLAACWEVAAHSGSGLAQAVGVFAQSARVSEEVRATLNAELAAPRATVRVLVFLPFVGLLLGVSMGSDPIGWLTGSVMGLLCGGAGIALTAAGWLWSSRLVQKVEREL